MKTGPAESGETLEPLQIVILDPEGDKGFMVGFGNSLTTYKYSEKQRDTYNDAIMNVLEDAGLRAFHQVGADEKEGTQMWEIRTGGIDRDFLEKLTPSIHQKAEEYAEEMSAI